MTPPASTERASSAQGKSDRFARAGSNVLRLGGVALTIVIVSVVFQVLTEGSFLSINNLLGILRSVSTVAIMGLGFLLVVLVGEIDLSFGSLYGLAASLIAVSWILWGWPVWLAIGFTFLVAAGWGTFNAFFTSVIRIPSFIVTLGSSTLIFGFTLLITNSNSYNPTYPPPPHLIDAGQLAFFTGLSNQKLPINFPMQGIWLIIVALVFGFLVGRSIFGFRLKAIGGNPAAAVLARIPVRAYKFAAFIGCALMACFAALLDFSFIGSTQPNAGQSLLFPTFAAVIIGGASLSGGRGTVAGTLAGAILLAILVNGVALLAAGPFIQQMLVGTVTIAAVVLDSLTRRERVSL